MQTMQSAPNTGRKLWASSRGGQKETFFAHLERNGYVVHQDARNRYLYIVLATPRSFGSQSSTNKAIALFSYCRGGFNWSLIPAAGVAASNTAFVYLKCLIEAVKGKS